MLLSMDMEHRVNNFKRLYAFENERPLIGFSAVGKLCQYRYACAWASHRRGRSLSCRTGVWRCPVS